MSITIAVVLAFGLDVSPANVTVVTLFVVVVLALRSRQNTTVKYIADQNTAIKTPRAPKHRRPKCRKRRFGGVLVGGVFFRGVYVKLRPNLT